MQSMIQDCVQDQKEKQLGQNHWDSWEGTVKAEGHWLEETQMWPSRWLSGKMPATAWGPECGSPAHMERSGELVDTWSPARRAEEGLRSQRHVCPGVCKLWCYPVSKCKVESNRGRQATWTAVLTHTHLSKHSIYTHLYAKLTKFKGNECVDMWQTNTAVPQYDKNLHIFPIYMESFLFSLFSISSDTQIIPSGLFYYDVYFINWGSWTLSMVHGLTFVSHLTMLWDLQFLSLLHDKMG